MDGAAMDGAAMDGQQSGRSELWAAGANLVLAERTPTREDDRFMTVTRPLRAALGSGEGSTEWRGGGGEGEGEGEGAGEGAG